MLEFSNNVYVKARKRHKCNLCHEIIEKGEIYNRYTGKYDGNFFDLKYHLTCMNFITTYGKDMEETEYDEESVYEYIEEKHCLGCQYYEKDCSEIPFKCEIIKEKYKEKTKNEM